ncbi:PH domain-containing protein [Arthrobacter sp.]|uniref:PH domain-containing protein n=1 Tax=Arthrobacter sp. TaxID=1667 RepID=UPI0026E0EA32|nr:PH domain-containing protein [Arthrobacter sp.]MDO5753742.1 PH domain-containing protein [Arthrobacter sp.]
MHNWLLEGEQVEIRCRQHSRILIWPITVALVLVYALFAGLAQLQAAPFSRWAPGAEAWRESAVMVLVAVGILVLLVYPVRRVVRWANTRYVLTNKRLLVRRGIFGRIKEAHVLEQVQQVVPVQRWRQKMVGSGDIQLHMLAGRVRTVSEVPQLKRFNEETQKAWTRVFRAAIQQTLRQGDYSGEVGMNEKELRELGRDY